MEIRIRDTGQVMFESEFRALFPNTSFPQILTANILNEAGADVVLEGPQAQPTRYQVAFRDGVEQIDGQWFTKYSVSDMNDEAKAALDKQQANNVRSDRDTKLSECDWTQMPDCPISNKAEWITYRQALRDLPTQNGFPWDMIWPEAPK